MSALNDAKTVQLWKSEWSKTNQITDTLVNGSDEQQSQAVLGLTHDTAYMTGAVGSLFFGHSALRAARGSPMRGSRVQRGGVGAGTRVVAEERAVAGTCFAAGTPILTPEGERPIENVRIGDVVLSRDPETSDPEVDRVTRTFVTPRNLPTSLCEFRCLRRLGEITVRRTDEANGRTVCYNVPA
jgi:hypothetical protein